MISIVRGNENDYELIADIGKVSFIESHGNSATQADIDFYVKRKFTLNAVKKELSNPENIFHVVYYNGEAAGYSKIIFNNPYQNSPNKNIAKLERLYLLQKFYDFKLGFQLLNLNIDLAKQHNQYSIWLVVWTGNERAVKFYQKTGFEIVGHNFFKISESHSNPNYEMEKKV